MRMLEEEDPQLHIVWNEALGGNSGPGHRRCCRWKDLKRPGSGPFRRGGWFGEGNIVYKGNVLQDRRGVGHFEPLRHYAEVHL